MPRRYSRFQSYRPKRPSAMSKRKKGTRAMRSAAFRAKQREKVAQSKLNADGSLVGRPKPKPRPRESEDDDRPQPHTVAITTLIRKLVPRYDFARSRACGDGASAGVAVEGAVVSLLRGHQAHFETLPYLTQYKAKAVFALLHDGFTDIRTQVKVEWEGVNGRIDFLGRDLETDEMVVVELKTTLDDPVQYMRNYSVSTNRQSHGPQSRLFETGMQCNEKTRFELQAAWYVHALQNTTHKNVPMRAEIWIVAGNDADDNIAVYRDRVHGDPYDVPLAVEIARTGKAPFSLRKLRHAARSIVPFPEESLETAEPYTVVKPMFYPPSRMQEVTQGSSEGAAKVDLRTGAITFLAAVLPLETDPDRPEWSGLRLVCSAARVRFPAFFVFPVPIPEESLPSSPSPFTALTP